MNNEHLLEPLKGYNSFYKNAIKEEAEKFFDELANKSNVDVKANKETIKELNKKQLEANNVNKKLNGYKIGRVFSIIGIIVFLLASIISIYLLTINDDDFAIKLLVAIFSVLATVGLFLLIILFLNKKIKEVNNKLDKLNSQIKVLTSEAWNQMAPLNALYDFNIPTTIIEKVIPILDFDKFFDTKKYLNLVKNYGFAEKNDTNSSILYVQSGTILGNPFLLQKAKVHSIINKIYTGSRVISWTETRRDSNGRSYTVRRTQTLTATSTHPAPSYTKDVKLIYGNDSGSDLSFSRSPSNMSGKTEKEYDKYVRNNEDELHKKAERDIKNGKSNPFTPLANSEFELLFGAYNRNHNVQYRLLFTPLAQLNLTKLIKSTDGFGDDFHFEKHKKINIIKSEHSQVADYSADPSIFFSNDFEWAKRNFVGYVCYYFKNIYFDFAPLMSIPLYQQIKSLDFIYGDDTPSNYSYYEHEALANNFDDNLLKDPASITEAIIKTKVIEKDGLTDHLEITAYSYRGENRIDYIPVMGGDGRLHNVPVPWIEYFPLERVSEMSLRNINTTRFDFNNKMNDNNFKEFIKKNSNGSSYLFKKGMFAILGGTKIDKYLEEAFDNIKS